MSTRMTADAHTVALYDSVTGTAFGKVFDSRDDATSFLDYLTEIGEPDPRSLHHADLARLREQWEERESYNFGGEVPA